MKIAILGTRGIPNDYGGFEQFAEYLSADLVKSGHSVTVYNPRFHPFKSDNFNGVEIVRKYSPENHLGAIANFIYDFLCLRHAIYQDYDIIYEAGYGTCAIFYPLLVRFKNRKSVLVTNMDGMEWQRSKWGRFSKRVMKYAEKLAVRYSDELIADNNGIADYFSEKYEISTTVLEYGADLVVNYSEQTLIEYNLNILDYFVVVARLEPENNVHLILDGFLKSKTSKKLIIIGNPLTKFGKALRNIAKEDTRVHFLGGLYDKSKLDDLRFFAAAYFHGHSVGGTNPSLLEAMASKSFIYAHSNRFNKDVLGEGACYFFSSREITALVNDTDRIRKEKYENQASINSNKIKSYYNWSSISRRHIKVFNEYRKNRGI